MDLRRQIALSPYGYGGELVHDQGVIDVFLSVLIRYLINQLPHLICLNKKRKWAGTNVKKL